MQIIQVKDAQKVRGDISIPTAARGTQLYTRTGQQRILKSGWHLGATAGWTVNAAANVHQATMAAGGTASTLVIPVVGLKVGDTITAFSLVGQIESGGNVCTVDAGLFKQTAAAADITVSTTLGDITQVSVTADAILSASKTLATAEVVAADEAFFILVTATTGASTDIALISATVTVTEA